LPAVEVQLEQVGAALPSYEVGEEIGRGSTGIVIAARHRQLGRDVAVKLLPPDLAENPNVRRRFLSEAKLLASFSHTHIVPVYDFVERDGLCLLVMERLTGGTLHSYARAGLDAPGSCAATLAVCSGLHYAHDRGVLHRDVKPANVLTTEDGVVKMTDFGIAKVLGGDETLVTRSGFVLGTPAYMAPEQASGSEPTPATDVYGAGTVLYELLAGRLPFPPESNPLQMLYSHVHSDPQPLRQVAPDVPEELGAVVMRALQRDPADRYATANDLGLAVAGAAANAWGQDWMTRTPFPVSAAPMVAPTVADMPAEPPPAPPASPARGWPRQALVLGVLALLAVAALVVALVAGGGDSGSPSNESAGAPAAPPKTSPAGGWTTVPPAPTPRQQAPAAVLAGKAWLLGGLKDGPGGSPVALRTVESFDMTIRQWGTNGPPLPTPLNHAMAATLGNRVIVLGGWIPRGSDISATSSNRAYAMQGDRWKALPSMRAPRVAGAAVTVGHRIVVVGGQANDRLVPSTEVFDGSRWTPADDIPTPREHLAAATDGTYVYAVGGRALDPGKNSSAFERFDPGSGKWSKLPDLPEEMGGLGAAYVDGQIVVTGGETPTDVTGATYVYDISKRRWSKAATLRTPRHGMAVVAFGDTVYALEGATAAGHTQSTRVDEALAFRKRRG
jgi:non-specific serine/threonine protein kinase